MNRLTEFFFESSMNVFSISDVSETLDGTDVSKHGLIKRAIKNGEILNVRRGLYCLAPKFQKNVISVYGLAEHIYGPSYISLESALSYHGWIPEAVYSCTSVSLGNAKEFSTPLGLYSYQRIPQHILYFDVQRYADKNGNIFFMASPLKALVDYVYIHKVKWDKVFDVFQSLRIEYEHFYNIDISKLKELKENYFNKRVKSFISDWLKEVGNE